MTPPARTKAKASPDAIVAEFNRQWPVGTAVMYQSNPGADAVPSKTRTPAQVLGGHTAVVWIDGKPGAVALDALVIIQPEAIEEAKSGLDVDAWTFDTIATMATPGHRAILGPPNYATPNPIMDDSALVSRRQLAFVLHRFALMLSRQDASAVVATDEGYLQWIQRVLAPLPPMAPQTAVADAVKTVTTTREVELILVDPVHLIYFVDRHCTVSAVKDNGVPLCGMAEYNGVTLDEFKQSRRVRPGYYGVAYTRQGVFVRLDALPFNPLTAVIHTTTGGDDADGVQRAADSARNRH